MKISKDLVAGLGIAIFILSASVLLQTTEAWASGETCSNGSSAPCNEDAQLLPCTVCHSIRLIGGNRNGTDRQIFASSGTNRHEMAPRRADWTSLVQSMYDKGAVVDVELTAGYLNTNYCTSCSGPILGSPVVSAITDTGATLTWSTSAIGFEDEPTNTVLFYGTNKADVLLGPGCGSCQQVNVAAPIAHHVVNLTGLTQFTQYYVVNQATSARGTVRSSYAIKFRTHRGGGVGGGGGCTPGTDPLPSRIYLSDSNTDAPSVVAIDQLTNTQVASIPVSGTPAELEPHPDGSTVYVMEGSNIAVIDVLGNIEINSLLGGGGDLFNQLAVSSDGTKLYVVYRKILPSATLEIKVYDTTDPTLPTLTTTVSNPVFNGCYGPLGIKVKPDGSQLYLACRPIDTSLPDRFYMVNTTTYVPTQTATFTRDLGNNTSINALSVMPNGSQVYVARTHATSGSSVEYFDGTTGAHTTSMKISLPDNSLPRAGVITPDGSRLYVVDQVKGIHVIDTATHTRLLTTPPATSRGTDIAMTPNGSELYSTLLFELFQLDASTHSWLSTVTGGFSSAFQITISPGRAGTPEVCPPPSGGGPIPSRIYLSNSSSGSSGDYDRVVAIDPLTNTEITSIPASGAPGELVPHPDGSTLYVMEDSNIAVIDVLGNIEINSLLGGGGDLFNQLAVSPDGTKLYVVYRKILPSATLEIKVYNTTDPTLPTLTTTVSDPVFNGCYGPLGIKVKPDGSQLYLACRPINTSLPDRFYMVNTTTYVPTQTATFTRDLGNYTFINALSVMPDGSQVYVARTHATSGSSVEYFDGTTGAHTTSMKISLPDNSLPRAGVITLDGSRLYVVDQVKGIHVIDTATNTRLLTTPPATSRGTDIAMTPNGSQLYSTLLFELFQLDAPTHSWLSTVTGDFTNAFQITITPGHP